MTIVAQKRTTTRAELVSRLIEQYQKHDRLRALTSKVAIVGADPRQRLLSDLAALTDSTEHSVRYQLSQSGDLYLVSDAARLAERECLGECSRSMCAICKARMVANRLGAE